MTTALLILAWIASGILGSLLELMAMNASLNASFPIRLMEGRGRLTAGDYVFGTVMALGGPLNLLVSVLFAVVVL